MQKTIITNELYEYVQNLGVNEHPILKKIRDFNSNLSNGHMQITPEEGQFLGLLTQITHCTKYLEVGVFTGYSSLVVALNMPQNGKMYCLDNNLEYLNIAKNFWQMASVDTKIITMHGDASVSLETLLDHEHIETFDIAFIDAQKSEYKAYYEYCYRLIKPGGLILIDNVLMGGKVIKPGVPNYAKKINEFNQFLKIDSRVNICMLPIADGLTIAYKKEKHETL